MQNTKNSFQFQQIILISNLEKSGRVLKIFPRTLITSKNNTIGKSTLLKSLFWALGCEVTFEEEWLKLETSTLIEFSVNDEVYKVKRTKDSISLYDNAKKQWDIYQHITGEYLNKLNHILNFNTLLKSNKATKLSKVPPAFYFSPTYIEQMNGWAQLWQSFNNLGQFNENNRLELLKYLCGILDKEYYDKKLSHNGIEQKIEVLKENIKKNTDIFTYLNDFQPVNDPLTKIKNTSANFISAQNLIKDKQKKYITLTSKLNSIDNEIEIIQIAVGELEQDYVFSIENIESTTILCPTCGVEHHNNLINRFSLINDTNKLIENLNALKQEKVLISEEIFALSKQIDNLYNEFTNIFDNNDYQENINDFFIKKSLIPSVSRNIDYENIALKKSNKERNTLKKEINNIELSNLESFEDEFINYFNSLSAKMGIKISPQSNFYEILKLSSGGANQIKIMLAKRLTILHAINLHSEIIIPPFVIDSLRQQDMDDLNYELLLEILINNIPENIQLIFAAVQNDFINKIKDDFEEIILEETLLTKEEYELCNFLFNSDS